jgi:succinate dehydrogenase / fumarate reductase flavoprotein subunit
MQGLADGYFVIPYTIGGYLAETVFSDVDASITPEFKKCSDDIQTKIHKLLSIKGEKTVAEFHRELGLILWEHCGMSRNEEGLLKARSMIQKLRKEFWENVYVPGIGKDLNQSLENAGRVADFLEFGELMCRDALTREESCGGHFREESQTEENEAKRDDENFSHVAVWEYKGEGSEPVMHKEPLTFEYVTPSQRSYK